MNTRAQIFFAIGGGAIGGALLGIAGVMEWANVRAYKKYEESSTSMRRAYEMALDKKDTRGPVETEEELGMATDKTPIATTPAEAFGTDDRIAYGQIVNPYHAGGVDPIATTGDMFVDGGVSDYGCSYLEEEDYYDADDGYAKYEASFVIDESQQVHFFIGSEEIQNWGDLMGESIVVDFLNNTTPTYNPVLYVRNHRTNTDFEVTRTLP